MKLPYSVPSQGNLGIVTIEQTLQHEITCFVRPLGERTYKFENEWIYCPKFAQYAESSSSANINS